MGQQLRVRAKRKRLQSYLKRLKEAVILRKATKGRSDDVKKAPAKKAAAKKAPAKKAAKKEAAAE
jgi:DNA end-binding protein Ku